MKNFLYSFLFLQFAIYSCTSTPPELPSPEKQILQSLLPELIDAVYIYNATLNSPPLITTLDNYKNESLTREGIDSEKREKVVHHLKELTQNKISLTIYITDSLYPADTAELSYSTNSKSALKNSKESFYLNKGCKIDLNTVKLHSPFVLSTINPKDSANLNNRSNEVIITFTGLILNREQTEGILTCQYSCGLQNNKGFTIFIKKDGNNWLIKKLENTWIA